jgi:RNA polymerase sigma-70 factor (ECF subfamily)
MLYIWESRESIVIENSLKSYLFAAVKHRCLNAIKKKLYHKQVHEQLYEKLKDQFEEPDYYLFNELSDNIEKAIRELPDNYRKTFELSRFGEISNAQIANQLEVSMKTVEYRITQSLKILRVKLKDYLPLLGFWL